MECGRVEALRSEAVEHALACLGQLFPFLLRAFEDNESPDFETRWHGFITPVHTAAVLVTRDDPFARRD
jgi:hypothetical protein